MKRLLLLPAILMLATACSGKPEIPPPAVRTVKAMTVGATDAALVLTFGGDVRARHETVAGFRVAGKIVERLVDVGAPVTPGQPLARLDATDLALRAGEATAQREQADADTKRYRVLHDKGFVSQSAVDARETLRKAASAQAALASNQASYATLTADHAGVVTAVLAQQGQVVAAGQGVFRLARDGEREVVISIPESALTDIRAGSEAEISFWSAPGKRWRGRVRELAPMADPATRTYAACVSILDGATPALGMSATVSFRLPRTNSLLIPMTSIFQQGNQPAVWVISQDNTLGLRPVRVLSYDDDGARIAGGLAIGERIVAAGASRLYTGEQVRIAEDIR